MTKTKCKKKDEKELAKPTHKYVCHKCGRGSNNEDKLCKPKKNK